jgi:hypothetical protein
MMMSNRFGRTATGTCLVGAGVLTAGLLVAPATQAQPCGGAMAFGSGGSQCDGAVNPDGSFERCVSVYVMGFGGWNCYMVFPPPAP